MWTLNDKILALSEHYIGWADEYGRKMERRIERRRAKEILNKINLPVEDWCNGNTPASDAGDVGSTPSSSA